jgi:hypothetical protein
MSMKLRYKPNSIYDQIIEWLETHDGVMPRSYIKRDRKKYRDK